MPIPDLQHRIQPHFPEVSANGQFESREYMFRNAARHALLILADSEIGKEDILNCYEHYGARPEHIKVLPYLPSSYMAPEVDDMTRARIRAQYHLPDRYLFYPAQFWPHKNHLGIVEALSILKARGHGDIQVVFCGARGPTILNDGFRTIMTRAESVAVRDQIHYLGFVPDHDVAALYAEAVGLVMTTFFGPANIPVVEAWAYGCPVLSSDVRGIREQVGEAGILVSAVSPESIAEGILTLWTDEAKREALIRLGAERLGLYGPEAYRERLDDIIETANARVADRR